MLASDVLIRVRDTLADPTANRWSDSLLLRLLDEAQNVICFKAKILRETRTLVAVSEQSTYSLPSNITDIIKVKYKPYNKNIISLPIISSTRLDEILTDNIKPGTPQYAVKNNLNKYILELAPAPKFTENVPFDITKATEIIVTYISKPNKITALTDELDLDEAYKIMLARYVIGNALRDDMDTQNRLVGNEELQMFNAWLSQIELEASKDFTFNSPYTTAYRPLS